jgi:hypothetical protein
LLVLIATSMKQDLRGLAQYQLQAASQRQKIVS